ncbi:uncharacterized protein LOC131940135 [Physella acuta]|uniref:uncharacterized protein LOC131940135 n=1 Tax=Physella acuta TaxID=109671 RepID=UPI0027DE8546|nr:uncharacterized protein LOC131940135 [Physella acuta]
MNFKLSLILLLTNNSVLTEKMFHLTRNHSTNQRIHLVIHREFWKHQGKNKTESRTNDVKKLTELVHNLEENLAANHVALSNKIMELQAELNATQSVQNIQAPPHAEQGDYYCGKVENFQLTEGRLRMLKNVTFAKPFNRPPVVSVSLTSIDMSNKKGFRFGVSARSVTTTGMQVVCETWADTVYNSATAHWIAVEA